MEIRQPILYVDDEEINLYIFDMLLNTSFEVFKAISADVAFEILASHPEIKLIITDWSMPEMDGLTFARKASTKYQDKKFLMLSAYVKSQEIEEAINEGILEDYLSKPLDREMFLNKVQEIDC
ncbi:MAG: response regulator [Reichenbachiella sp.]